MNKQETTALNIAKFIRGQTLLLLEKLDALDLDDETADCEKLHEQAEGPVSKAERSGFGKGKGNGERERILIRCRKALAGCRGAALTGGFV